MAVACLIHDDAVYNDVHNLLQQRGCETFRFSTEAALLRGLCRQHADLVIIHCGRDAAMEDRILSWLACRTGESTPVLLLSSRAGAGNAARALDAGADDFIAEPFESLELHARIGAALRRHCRNDSAPQTLSVAGFTLDRRTCQVLDRGTPVTLTMREFAMAWLFFSQPNACLSRETIGIAVWSTNADIAGRTMEQHVYKLRKKLQLSSARGVTISTTYARGYRLVLAPSTPIAVPATRALPARRAVQDNGGFAAQTPGEGLCSVWFQRPDAALAGHHGSLALAAA